MFAPDAHEAGGGATRGAGGSRPAARARTRAGTPRRCASTCPSRARSAGRARIRPSASYALRFTTSAEARRCRPDEDVLDPVVDDAGVARIEPLRRASFGPGRRSPRRGRRPRRPPALPRSPRAGARRSRAGRGRPDGGGAPTRPRARWMHAFQFSPDADVPSAGGTRRHASAPPLARSPRTGSTVRAVVDHRDLHRRRPRILLEYGREGPGEVPGSRVVGRDHHRPERSRRYRPGPGSIGG